MNDMTEREMMEAIGRLAAVKVGETDAREAVAAVREVLENRVEEETKQWRPRPLVLSAMAAAVAVVGTLWIISHGHAAPKNASPPIVETPGEVEHGKVDTSNAAFERWAAPYRKLRIPMVTREAAAAYKPWEVVPVGPSSKM